MKYSLIIPVFNRPDEVRELLESMTRQTLRDFEVIVVEDGSETPCKDVCDKYAGLLDLRYFYKENSGPGQSRNYGVERARGEWVVILDSDVVLPEGYLQSVERSMEQGGETVAWGGPDAAHPSFTPIQKAISYSMTSFFTTGGIRGGKKSQGHATAFKLRKMDKFYPRSFNMGIRRDVYQQLGGFSKMRFGEDIDFSYRIAEAGYQPRLLPDAWVWHKRRTDFSKFFRQVYNSGIARINLEKRHPGTLRLVHLLPAVFTVGVIALALLFAAGLLVSSFGSSQAVKESGQLLCRLSMLPIALYSLLLCADAALQNKSLRVGMLAVPAAFVQLTGYGMGFIESWWRRCVLGKDEFQAFERNFYK